MFTTRARLSELVGQVLPEQSVVLAAVTAVLAVVRAIVPQPCSTGGSTADGACCAWAEMGRQSRATGIMRFMVVSPYGIVADGAGIDAAICPAAV